MNRKTEVDYQEDPYEVIRRMRAALQDQRVQIEEYEIVCNSLVGEKNAAVSEANEAKNQAEGLRLKVERQQLTKSRNIGSALTLIQERPSSKQNRQYFTTLSPQLVKTDVVSSHIISLGSPKESAVKALFKSKEFIPGDIVFKKREAKAANSGRGHISAESSSEHCLEKVGDYLIEDFMVICPDFQELRKLREGRKEAREFSLAEYYFFNFNQSYKSRKPEYLKEIARRAFPLGAQARRRTIDNYEQFKRDMEFPVDGRMGEEYFILNLKGDFVDAQKEKAFLGGCNPSQALFVVCLKVPDFIPIRDEKSFTKKEQEVWMVDKVYAVLTYLPFFHIHLSLLSKIHKALQPQWHKFQGEEVLSRNLQRSMTQTEQSLQIKQIIGYFLNRKPDFNLVCLSDSNYFGCLPSPGFNCEYAMAQFACPIFFSNFAYEQMLLLMTAMFMEKTIIFTSKSQSASSLCALFLTSILSPFKFNNHLILNCDREKIDNIVFEFPLILVASFKKDSNYANVLRMFIESNCDRFKGFSGKDQSGPLVLVDIDSNSIFYDPLLNQRFEKLIVSPGERLRDAYMEVNPSHSKSFTFPQKMPVEYMTRPRNDSEKNEEERRKLLKEYMQKIDNNTSKWPTYALTSQHQTVLTLLTEFIQSFGVSASYEEELIKSTGSNRDLRKELAHRHLLARHPMQEQLVNVLADSQLFADYLDDLERRISSRP